MYEPSARQSSRIQTLLDWAKDIIEQQRELRFQAPRLEARLLFTFATGKTHTWLVTYANEPVKSHINENELAVFVEVVNQRLAGKPIAFILGTQDFWSLTLKVSDCTLIPRQDTEVLIETILSLRVNEHVSVLDLGTGTGAIALALAKERPHWHITGVDKIPEAVDLARDNGLLNGLDVRFLESDWFSALHTSSGPDKFDIIASNPPYVQEKSEYVNQGDLRFEPLSALVSGKDGLDDIRVIIGQASTHLHPNGYLLIEHGDTQYNNVQTLLCDAGFTEVESVVDINQIVRITLGKWQGVCV